MRPFLALKTHREAIRAIALRHRVTDVRVFGSVVHGDDTEDSDLDLLVEPTDETTMMDIAKIQWELGQLLPVPAMNRHPLSPGGNTLVILDACVLLPAFLNAPNVL